MDFYTSLSLTKIISQGSSQRISNGTKYLYILYFTFLLRRLQVHYSRLRPNQTFSYTLAS